MTGDGRIGFQAQHSPLAGHVQTGEKLDHLAVAFSRRFYSTLPFGVFDVDVADTLIQKVPAVISHMGLAYLYKVGRVPDEGEMGVAVSLACRRVDDLQTAVTAGHGGADNALLVFQQQKQVESLGFFGQTGERGNCLIHIPVVIGATAGVGG